LKGLDEKMHETNKDDFIIEEGNLIDVEDVMFIFDNYI